MIRVDRSIQEWERIDMNTMLGIVSTGLLEAATERGGGIELVDYEVARILSQCMDVVIISPYYQRFRGKRRINDHFFIDEVYFPSVKNYPPKSRLERFFIPLTEPFFAFLAGLKVVRLKREGLRIVILDNEFTGLLAGIIARILRLKVVFSEGNLAPWVYPYLNPSKRSFFRSFSASCHLAFGRLICFLSHLIRVASDGIMKGMVVHGIRSSKILVIGSGVNDEFFVQSTVKHKNGMLRIGFLGMLDEIKGADLLLEVVRKADQELSNVRFILIGDGPYESFFQGMPNIEHLGSVERSRLPQCLKNVDIMLFFQKDLGFAVMESMAAGKAVVSLNVGEVPKLVMHMKNGLLCDANPRSYIQAISLLDGNGRLLERLSKTARETALIRFDWKEVGKKWRSVVSSLVAM